MIIHFNIFIKKKKINNITGETNLLYEIKLCIYFSIVSLFDKHHCRLFPNSFYFRKNARKRMRDSSKFNAFPTIIIAELFFTIEK